ncbi:ribonuclease E/G [Magnetospira sp. QH-2]|uniref:Rne/Rng family ribonuclease n=1 Tax=Magnetospira sp. (strain QH-2) TaxID=1288970 RepID=UPI0018E078C3
MLIDATHAEETRVVVAMGNRLEDFDVEVASRKQLKGNVYLAKVTRVEPSLQAAFVEYGGNRHGFLAFSEIHPDYYQIPVADREALIAETPDDESANGEVDEPAETNGGEEGEGEGASLEVLGGDDVAEETEARRPYHSYRNYKIQEVIKRRQVLLVQVVKEERGNKGAALTTYLSLAGRYCVLMPNTTRAGGISRKISSANDRKRLKSVLGDLSIPEGMAVIVRTAGAQRSKAEIKRDYDYLLRVWDTIRTQTLESAAPCLIHEEGNLIKRSIRDLYDKDIDEVVVEGDDGYRTAKDFMKMLIPSHAKKVQPYKDIVVPLFHRYQVESQLDAMHGPDVQLKSGGYIVINPTEALVSIDVNSGRSTKERNIEETAYRTNLEAADEIARQLRLRDLAGLIVIDFIDMEVSRYQTNVERRLKEAMRIDRARIQIGRISPFGLMELSRQRLRPSLIETSFESCPHCAGTGVIRSTESTALHVLRAIEEEGLRGRAAEIAVHVATSVALYILNYKRDALADIESRYGFSVMLMGDDSLIPPDHRIERLRARSADDPVIEALPVVVEPVDDEEGTGEDGSKRRKRRRRRRGKRPEEGETMDAESRDAKSEEGESEGTEGTEGTEGATASTTNEDGDEEAPKKRRRRGRRGGRRRRRPEGEENGSENGEEASAASAAPAETGEQAPSTESEGSEQPEQEAYTEQAAPVSEAETTETTEAAEPEEKPKKPARRRAPRKKKEAVAAEAPVEAAPEPVVEAQPEPKPKPEPEPEPEPEEAPALAGTEVIDVDAVQSESRRKGWWSRLLD